jgi:hypothetical protein
MQNQSRDSDTKQNKYPLNSINNQNMTSITLPIFGQGSQPAEEDGVELDYLAMPEEMATYRMPTISVDLNAADLARAKTVLHQLEQDLGTYPANSETIDLISLEQTNRQFVDELLGEGEVSMLCGGAQTLRIQESVLAGVWRSQRLDAQKHIATDSSGGCGRQCFAGLADRFRAARYQPPRFVARQFGMTLSDAGGRDSYRADVSSRSGRFGENRLEPA